MPVADYEPAVESKEPLAEPRDLEEAVYEEPQRELTLIFRLQLLVLSIDRCNIFDEALRIIWDLLYMRLAY